MMLESLQEEENWRRVPHAAAFEWVACHRPPAAFPFAVFVCDPHNEVFLWFANAGESLAFLRQHGLVMDTAPDLDAEARIVAGQRLLAGADKFSQAFAGELNVLYRATTLQKIEWLGTLENLRRSAAPFCAGWRVRFREAQSSGAAAGEDLAASHIGANELPGFIEYITVGHF
jgi:hypothetical protein